MGPAGLTFVILVLAIVAFITDRLPIVIVALAVPVAVWATGVLVLRHRHQMGRRRLRERLGAALHRGFGPPHVALYLAFAAASRGEALGRPDGRGRRDPGGSR